MHTPITSTKNTGAITPTTQIGNPAELSVGEVSDGSEGTHVLSGCSSYPLTQIEHS